jgi:hypothetical protein
MRKAEEVERLRFTQTPPPPIDSGTPPELEQPRLVRCWPPLVVMMAASLMSMMVL